MKNKKNIKGFTLIELLVVVAIIGVLAAVGVTAFQGFTDNAKQQAMKSIHAGVVKKVSAELQKCSIGSSTFMNGTNRTNGATYSVACNANSATNAANAYTGLLTTSNDKNPWTTSQFAVNAGNGFTKGRTNIQRAGNLLYIRSCWDDGCAAANRQQDSVQAE
jgi:type IV pilus assembly protein PilA